MDNLIFNDISFTSFNEVFYSYYNCYDDKLFIPLINVNIVNHPLNKTSNGKYIDFSYVVFENVVQVKINNEIIYESFTPKTGKYEFEEIEARNINTNTTDIFVVLYKTAFLQVSSKYNLSDSMLLPIDTSYFKQNMLQADVNNFFERDNLPSNLRLYAR